MGVSVGVGDGVEVIVGVSVAVPAMELMINSLGPEETPDTA